MTTSCDQSWNFRMCVCKSKEGWFLWLWAWHECNKFPRISHLWSPELVGIIIKVFGIPQGSVLWSVHRVVWVMILLCCSRSFPCMTWEWWRVNYQAINICIETHRMSNLLGYDKFTESALLFRRGIWVCVIGDCEMCVHERGVWKNHKWSCHDDYWGGPIKTCVLSCKGGRWVCVCRNLMLED